MERREFLKLALGSVALFAFTRRAWAARAIEKLVLSDEEWKTRLPLDVYLVLRKEGTERPFSSPLLHETRQGMYVCAGCELPLFPSEYKYDSDTGWPSFFNAIPGHLGTRPDHREVIERTEYHCARCGGHHGHLFKDGPKPTGLRYSNNGTALKFIPLLL